VREVDTARVRHAVLAVRREGHVLRGERAAGTDLRGLLAEERGVERELPLALERRGLGVEAADEHHVAVEPAEVVGAEARDPRPVRRVLLGRHATPVRRHELQRGVVGRLRRLRRVHQIGHTLS
jgi:hypothetical protein